MQFEFKAVTRELRLGEYTPEMEAAKIQVWVNVPRETLRRMRSVSVETPDEEFLGLLGELWGNEDWPMADILALQAHCLENDPQLWIWLVRRTYELVMEYQSGQKKG